LATRFGQTWSSSGWPQERKDKFIHSFFGGIELPMLYICYYLENIHITRVDSLGNKTGL